MVVRVSAIVIGGLLGGLAVAAGMQHDHGPHSHDAHHHHTHAHSHNGYVHTHEHSHPAHEEHPSHETPGDHHECASGHGDSAPFLLTAASRDTRRPVEHEFTGLQSTLVSPLGPESPGLAPPDHPPRPPTRQDSLPQLRTVVLLT